MPDDGNTTRPPELQLLEEQRATEERPIDVKPIGSQKILRVTGSRHYAAVFVTTLDYEHLGRPAERLMLDVDQAQQLIEGVALAILRAGE